MKVTHFASNDTMYYPDVKSTFTFFISCYANPLPASRVAKATANKRWCQTVTDSYRADLFMPA